MLLNKKNNLSDLEMNHLMSVREMWRSAKQGLKVCVVSPFKVDWNTVLGKYYDVVYPHVVSGMVYLRVEDSVEDGLQLEADDLDNVIVEIKEAI
jgi:hypothetical protein